MNIASPDITVLDFSALFDVSGVPATVTLTNQSTVVHASALDWWFVVTTPSGATIHSGTSGAPDVNHTAFTTKNYTSWPQPMGQIEWGQYEVEAFVKDSQGDTYSLKKTIRIARPFGSVPSVKGNFGVASVLAEMRCERGQLYVEDTTSLTWNGITPFIVGQKYTLIYPLDTSDSQPPNFELSDTPNGLLPISYSGEGYSLVRTLVAEYDNGLGGLVRIKYKYKDTFAVECDADLCQIICEYQKMVDSLEDGGCDSATKDKVVKIGALIQIALIGKSQPLCGVKVGKVIAAIKRLGDFCCDCGPNAAGVGINGIGINGTSNTGSFTFDFEATCGDLSIVTFTQVGDNVVLKLKDKTYAFNVISAGTGSLSDAFSFQIVEPSGPSCTRTVRLGIDSAKLDAWKNANIPSCCPEYVNIIEKGTVNPPSLCPNSYFPATVWTPDGVTSLGLADDINHLIAKLIGDSSSGGWASKGKWVAAGYCQAVLYRATGITGNIPKIPVSFVAALNDTACVNNAKTYNVPLTGYCGNLPVQSMIYPYNAHVKFTPSGTPVFLANVTSYANLLAQLNAASGKPANISFSTAGGSNEGDVIVVDTNCNNDNAVTVDIDTVAQVLFGAATNMTQGIVEGMYVIDPKTNTELGLVCGTKNEQEPWHSIKVGNFIYMLQSNTGKLSKIDVSVPMYPVKVLEVTLPNTGGPNAAFGTEPRYNGNPATPSYYDTYFVTDLNSPVSGFLFIVESSSGSIWKYNLTTDTVAGSNYNIKLVGRCPRVVFNGSLYLSQDGSRESDLGLSSGVARHNILQLDLSTVGSGSLTIGSIGTVVSTGDEPWAISWDPTRSLLWISTVQGDLLSLDPLGGALASYPNLWALSGNITGLASSHIFGDRIYLSGLNIGTKWIDLATLAPATPFDVLSTGGVPNQKHYNFNVPKGACYGVVTFNNGTTSGTRGGIAKYTLDGHLLSVLVFTHAGNMYNVIPLLNVSATLPNGLCS